MYEWIAIDDKGCCIVIYVGRAGGKKGSCYSEKGTLYRGISELQRSVFTSNSPKYDKLDTDFIVGTAIKFFETEGFTCYWRHIDDDPQKEKHYVKLKNPILQDKNGRIKNKFRCQHNSGSWKFQQSNCKDTVSKAENLIFSLLAKYLPICSEKKD